MKNKKLIGILFGLVLGVFGLLGPLDLLSPSGPTGKWPSKRLLSGVSFAQGITTDRGARPDTGTANPVPLINLPLAPDTALPDGSGGILTVNGTGFVSGSVVNWNGAPRATTFVSQSQVKAKILSSDVAQRDTASVTVVNPGPGGGTSNVAFFSVTVPTSSVELGGPTGFDAGSVPYDVAVADFNGDGKLDLAVMNGGSNNVSVLLGNGDGTFQAAVNYDVGPNPNRGIVVGDFNGDGKPDLAVSDSGSNEVSVLLGNGDGTFQAAVNYGVGMYPSGIAVGDFNRDGKLDLVVPNQNCPEGGPCGASTVSVLLGNGDGTFQPHVDYAVGSSDPNWVTVGDFNGDGKLDLAVAYGYPVMSGVSILLGNGDGTFQPPVNYWFGVNNATIATADFNGDGKLDLAVVYCEHAKKSGMWLISH
ncbi:MAG TPA: VCBS repeat-containing protein [Terriglobia bacterium]|nr:VCBS repeat-containing protein [Terriglobia bacterium]